MRTEHLIDNSYENRTPYGGSEYIDNEDFSQTRGMTNDRGVGGRGHIDERYVVRMMQFEHKDVNTYYVTRTTLEGFRSKDQCY